MHLPSLISTWRPIIDQYLAALGQLDPLPVANDALSGGVAHIS
ncbi:hypothetical protein [Pseudomonas sp. M47T1]|nr:hypothetical protein [Pseudomonas sp. M47T1]